ncbi:GSU2403 family nucleotidyltransferase fold protein [Paraburkholderia sp. GAS32]|uniref:GSU2403 family nucleotidyltransferase fold protein n=1 Tax=Paraburkholderia sp. GAS32 TaxID=3035129 RepID=UPI003D1B7334
MTIVDTGVVMTTKVVMSGREFFLDELQAEPAKFAHWFERARAEAGHAECLCMPGRRLKLQIRLRDGLFHLAVWPLEGEAHRNDKKTCFFHKLSPDSSGRGSYAKVAIVDRDDGSTDIKVEVPLSVRADERAPSVPGAPSSGESRTAQCSRPAARTVGGRIAQPGEFEPNATEANAGVVAQKLHHLEVLLHEPWLVTIPAEESGLGEPVVDLRVPNPVSFMVQKLLIREKRTPQKRAQDVLYIYDAMYKFNGSIEGDLAPIWTGLEGTLHPKQQQSIRDSVKELFSDVNDIIREAVTIPTDRKLDPVDVLMVCRFGFEDLFR